MTYTEKAQAVFDETKEGLKTVFDELNQGQQKKLQKNEKVYSLLKRYGMV